MKKTFLFLPAAGYRYDTSSLYYEGSNGYYWSRTLDTSSPSQAQLLYFKSSRISNDYDLRFGGRSVRPVRVSK